MTTTDDFTQLAHDRFGLTPTDLAAAAHTLPTQRPGATALTAPEAALLDQYGFTEEPESHAHNAADVTITMGLLYNTAFTASEAAQALGVSDSRLRQRRLAHTIWGIDDDGKYVYPAIQFEQILDPHRSDTTNYKFVRTTNYKFVRGLDRVLPHILTRNLHPLAIATFLGATPQAELLIDGQPNNVIEWLRHGESTDPVFRLIEVSDWAGA